MAVIVSVLLVFCFLALEWYVRARALTPLPEAVRCVFTLSEKNEGDLEYCVRGHRFLRRHGLVRGPLVLELCHPSAHGRRAAELLAQRGDIIIREIEE